MCFCDKGKERNVMQKYFYLLLLVWLFCFPSMMLAQNYQLVWSDEFDSTQINLSEWEYEVNGNGGGNNELQYYTSRSVNSFVKDGNFSITALKESYSGKAYTSARLHTKKSWQYGKIEARIKLPYGKGIWPAFWMLGTNISSVGWPKCGEIDIMEMIGGTASSTGGDRRVFGTVHWDQGGHASYGLNYSLTSGKLNDDFHTFFILWDAERIAWYFDNFQYCVINTQPAGLNAFRAPFFIILNLAVGGNWPGSPDASTIFPQTMEFDYIRVYQNIPSGVQHSSPPQVYFELAQNYPNPFNPTTTIQYQIPASGFVSLKIFDLLGKEIAVLVNSPQEPGKHSVPFNASHLTSGVYYYKLQSGMYTQVKKMQIVQ